MALTGEKLLGLYRKMLLTRAMDDKHVQLLQEGKVYLFAHPGTGQEAVAIGVTGPLRKEDILFGTHRGNGEYIGKGMRTKDIWAELLGKKTGLCKGKGTLHLADKEINMQSFPGCLGADLSMAVGSALACKMRNTGQVTIKYIGEGAFNQADSHPSMCMAALWQLPVVFAVCNNQFCEMSHMCEHYPTEDVAPRAMGYGIPFEIVDGQDIEVTYEATERAVDHARSGKGPYLVEYKTFRMTGHYTGDTAEYMKKEDLEKWGKRDPIDLCQKKLLDRGILTPEEDKNLRKGVQVEVEEAVNHAFSCPDPILEDLFEDVYSQKGVL